MIAALAGAVASEVMLGKKVVLVVGTPRDAAEYIAVLKSLCVVGTVTFLYASLTVSNDWKRERFDSVHLCPSCEPWWMRAQDLAREASIRSTPTQGRAKKLPRELRRAIRQGRRGKGEAA